MTGKEIIEVLSNIDGEVLSDKNDVLTGMLSHFRENGLYFVTYKDDENLLVISGDIQTILFDLDTLHNYDIVVKRAGREVQFELDMEHDPNHDRDEEAYYKGKSGLNLIRVLQQPENPILEPNFEAIGFKIKRKEKEIPALLFSIDAIK